MNESFNGHPERRGFKPLPSGRSKMYSDGTGVVHAKKPNTDYANTIIENINTREYQLRTFYDPNHPSHLYSKEFSDKSKVVLYKPSAKYAESSALVIAHGPKTFKEGDNKLTPVEYIYDYAPETQQAFWQFLIGGMKAFQENTQDKEGMRVFVGGNNVSKLSNKEYRTSRSISNPHAHIIGFIEKHVEPHEENPPQPIRYLTEEQEYTKRIAPHFARRVHNRLPESRRDQLALTPQEQPPFGYAFTTPYSVDEIISDPKSFAEMMHEHHKAYIMVSRQMEKVYSLRALKAGYEQFIPESYRFYLEKNNDGQLDVTISPEFFSHAGVMEAASDLFILDRGPAHPQRFSDEYVSTIQKEAALFIAEVVK